MRISLRIVLLEKEVFTHKVEKCILETSISLLADRYQQITYSTIPVQGEKECYRSTNSFTNMENEKHDKHETYGYSTDMSLCTTITKVQFSPAYGMLLLRSMS